MEANIFGGSGFIFPNKWRGIQENILKKKIKIEGSSIFLDLDMFLAASLIWILTAFYDDACIDPWWFSARFIGLSSSKIDFQRKSLGRVRNAFLAKRFELQLQPRSAFDFQR